MTRKQDPPEKQVVASQKEKKAGSALKHDLTVGIVSGIVACVLTTIASWFLLSEQFRQARRESQLGLKQSVIKEIAPLLSELQYLHTFKVWSTIETHRALEGKAQEEVLNSYVGLDLQNQLREKYPTEHAKSLDYDLRKTQLMGLLLLVQVNFGYRQAEAARTMVDDFDDERLRNRVGDNWDANASSAAMTRKIMEKSQKEIRTHTLELLQLLVAESRSDMSALGE